MSNVYADKKKTAIVTISLFLGVAMVLVVIIGVLTTQTDLADRLDLPGISRTRRVIAAFCKPTHYKKECEKSLSAEAHKKGVKHLDHKLLAAEAFKSTRSEIKSALTKFPTIEVGMNDTRTHRAIQICSQLAKISIRDIERSERSIDHLGKGDFELFIEDLRVWTGGVLTYQDVCLNSFKKANGKAKEKMKVLLLKARERVANALAVVMEIENTPSGSDNEEEETEKEGGEGKEKEGHEGKEKEKEGKEGKEKEGHESKEKGEEEKEKEGDESKEKEKEGPDKEGEKEGDKNEEKEKEGPNNEEETEKEGNKKEEKKKEGNKNEKEKEKEGPNNEEEKKKEGNENEKKDKKGPNNEKEKEGNKNKEKEKKGPNNEKEKEKEVNNNEEKKNEGPSNEEKKVEGNKNEEKEKEALNIKEEKKEIQVPIKVEKESLGPDKKVETEKDKKEKEKEDEGANKEMEDEDEDKTKEMTDKEKGKEGDEKPKEGSDKEKEKEGGEKAKEEPGKEKEKEGGEKAKKEPGKEKEKEGGEKEKEEPGKEAAKEGEGKEGLKKNKSESHEKKSVRMAGKFPEWVSDLKRGILAMPLAEIKPDIVVAKDGSGKVKTLRQALYLLPKKSDKTMVIYIKEGVYHEHVAINGRMTSLVFIGDGPTKTIISGAKNFADGWPTFMTGTIDIDGDGFMARDIGFENTAGPTKLQAAAARVSSDYAVFYNCQFSGFHNTLYAVRSRQFYRDCTISGIVDFISGDALAVFQNCLLLFRTPLPGQPYVMTAQARSDSNGPGATIIQNCTITTEPGVDPSQSNAFLGRPRRPYSRTIIMQSFIDKIISPLGWTPYAGKLGLNTLFYSEFMNKGPGSLDSGRVKWPGIQTLTMEEAGEFSPGKFFAGTDEWITNTACPYYGNMLPM